MPTKKYTLPKRLEDLPAADLQSLMANPAAYDMTMKEYFQVIEYFGHVLAPIAPNDSNNEVNKLKANNELDKLKAENTDLKLKNAELKEALDKYKYKYERVMDLIDDIIDEMVDDEEDY